MNHAQGSLDLWTNKKKRSVEDRIKEKIDMIARENPYEAYQVYSILNAVPVKQSKQKKVK